MKSRNSFSVYTSGSFDKGLSPLYYPHEYETKREYLTTPYSSTKLKETENNMLYPISCVTSKPVRSFNINTPEKHYSYYPSNTEYSKSNLITQISNRLNQLETKLTKYQTKADMLRTSYQQSINNNTLLKHEDINTSLTQKQELELSENLILDQSLKYAVLRSLSEKRKHILQSNDYIKINNCLTKNFQKSLNNTTSTLENSLNNKLQKLKEENSKIKEKVIKTKRKMIELSKDIMIKIEDKINQEIRLIKQKNHDTLMEYTKTKKFYQKEIKNYKQEKELMTNEILKYKTELQIVSSQLFQSKDEIMKHLTEINSHLIPKLKQLQTNNKAYQNQFDISKENIIHIKSMYEEKLNTFELTLNNMTQEITESKKVNTLLEEEIKDLNEVNKKLTKELDNKGGQLFTTKSKVDMLSKQIKHKEEEFNKLQIKSQSINDLHIENESKYKRELSIKAKELRNTRDKSNKILNLKTQVETDAQSFKVKNEELNKDNNKLTIQLNEIRLEVKKYQSENEDYINEIFLLNEELTSLKNDLIKLKINLKEANKKESLYIEVNEINEKNKKEIENLNLLIKELVKHKEVKYIFQKDHIINFSLLNEYKSKRKNQHQKSPSPENENTLDYNEDDSEDYDKDDNHFNDSENQDTKSNLSHKKIISNIKEEEAEDLVEDNEELLNKIKEEKKQMKDNFQLEKDQLIIQFDKEKEKLNQEILHLKEELSELESHLSQYQTDYSLLEIQHTQLKVSTSELEATTEEQITQLSDQLKALNIEYLKQKNKIESSKEITDLLEQKSSLLIEIDEATLEFKRLKENNNSLITLTEKTHKDSSDEKIEQLNEQIKALQKANIEISSNKALEWTKAKTKIDALEKQIIDQKHNYLLFNNQNGNH